MASPSHPPHRYIAFLRAINVGGHTVKMDRLRALFEALGFTSVESFIASGNVIFDSPSADAHALEREIERHLRESLGYDVATFLRTPDEVAAAARFQPPSASGPEWEGSALYVAFLPAPPADETRERLMGFRNEIDTFDIDGREVYWSARKKFSESSFSGAALEKTLGMPATIRNVTTVRKLAAKYAPSE